MHQNYFTAIYKLIKRLNACTFVSRTENTERVPNARSVRNVPYVPNVRSNLVLKINTYRPFPRANPG